MEKEEQKRKTTFFMSMKFFYDYKVTLSITLIWFFIYFVLSSIWGLLNNLAFLDSFIRNPITYLLIPIVIFLTHIVKYGIENVVDFLYGKKASETEKIFDSEETFRIWREKFYSRINNNKILIPIATFSGICAVFIINTGTLYNVNIFGPPILLIANLVNLSYLFLISFGCTLGIIIIAISLIAIFRLGKDQEKLSIKHLVKKYQSQLSGDKLEVDPITYFEFQTYNKVISEFIFRLFFKLILVVFLVNLLSIFPLQLGIWSMRDFFLYTYFSLVIGLVIIFFFIITQHSLHTVLKNSRNVLLDTLNTIQDKLSERMGDELFSDGNITPFFKDGLKKLKYITTRKMEIKKLGTMPYDFLKILKLLGVASLSIIPIIIEFLPI